MSTPIVYDNAKWHYGGNFPKGLPDTQGGVHTGMFLAWLVLHDFQSALIAPEEVASVKQRAMTGTELLWKYDEALVSDMLSASGNSFAGWYYGPAGSGSYFADYVDTLARDRGPYEVASTWDNYDKLAPVIDQRFREWSSRRAAK